MENKNHIRTIGDYSIPSHEGYQNTIELPDGNNVVPLRSDTIQLVQNRCSFKGLRIHLHLRGSYYSFPCSILCTGKDAKLRNDILMFQQHQGESLSKAWTRFKVLLQKVPHYGIDLWLQVQIFYDHVNPPQGEPSIIRPVLSFMKKNSEDSWALLEDLALYDNESWNDPRDFPKPVKAISLPQDVLMNKIASSCEICSGPDDTQYCMENPEQAFVDYASSRTDEAGGKWFTFKPEQNNLGLVSNFMASQDARLSKFEADFKQQQGEMTSKIDTVLKAINDRITGALPSDTVKNPKLNVNSTSLVSSARSYPTKEPQCSSYIHGSINAITMCSKQPNKSHNDQPQDHDTIAEECKTSKEEGKEEKGDPENINTNPPSPPDPSISFITEKVCKLNSFLESLNLVPRSSDVKFVCTKENDGDVMFIEIIKKYRNRRIRSGTL
ncbi:hypothetical protein Tco_1270427 [Tanacetum coccineum]